MSSSEPILPSYSSISLFVLVPCQSFPCPNFPVLSAIATELLPGILWLHTFWTQICVEFHSKGLKDWARFILETWSSIWFTIKFVNFEVEDRFLWEQRGFLVSVHDHLNPMLDVAQGHLSCRLSSPWLLREYSAPGLWMTYQHHGY